MIHLHFQVTFEDTTDHKGISKSETEIGLQFRPGHQDPEPV